MVHSESPLPAIAAGSARSIGWRGRALLAAIARLSGDKVERRWIARASPPMPRHFQGLDILSLRNTRGSPRIFDAPLNC